MYRKFVLPVPQGNEHLSSEYPWVPVLGRGMGVCGNWTAWPMGLPTLCLSVQLAFCENGHSHNLFNSCPPPR